MAKTVGDVEALYNATTAYDPKDSTKFTTGDRLGLKSFGCDLPT
jgi:Asp-tRNA(Asn)/Glu-tRNA(Gln) amidotransferase A subunit family amidase